MKSHRSQADKAFLSAFCLDGCVMCDRPGGPLAGLIWIMAQGQAALIHRWGKSSRSESQLLTVTLTSSTLASRSNVITLCEDTASSMSSVLFTVCSEEFPLGIAMCTALYVHILQLCLCITLQVWDNWVTDDTHLSFKSTRSHVPQTCVIT